MYTYEVLPAALAGLRRQESAAAHHRPWTIVKAANAGQQSGF
jgi:hypothetical protein